ncbi:MAG: 4-hydroxy-tetrahydrodipicolinate synthase [Acidaminobacter sp.]|uniref:4-hydroxy-tetrahydrodipicolinate synthase n=1 Tax=Acidaminobacter sp. TaxID=1872102 RepID=UPI0013842416|nr:4-hydroxy-tetrahydrodipicolinate synthase [Acidaminobacter sp.]MZQ99554.1 4-hydroxy-tetrahydrodipicolinate synthase [Acidaminobacter sp.]
MLKGSFVVMVTPMLENQELDIESFKNNLDWYIEEGAPGVCVCGGTGEFASLSKEERLLLAETAVTQAKGRIKCIVGTAAETTREAIFYTKHAEEIGADAVMIINPYYCRPTEDEIFEHYKAISDATNIPIMVYNNPAHSGVDLKPEMIARLSTIQNVKYVKDASGDLRRISDIKRLTNGSINIFCGGEDLIYENYLLGAVGWISVCANIIPKQAQELFTLVQDNNLDEAKTLFLKLFPLLDLLENGPKAIQSVKVSMELIGRKVGPARLPHLPLNETETDALKKVLMNVGII